MHFHTALKLTIFCVQTACIASFTARSWPSSLQIVCPRRSKQTLNAEPKCTADEESSSYESSTSFIKGIVSSLTSVSNFFSLSNEVDSSPEEQMVASQTLNSSPTTAEELLDRIKADYTENNYLWTGKLDTSAFTQNCKFTDPTISFEGIDKYVQNVGNLVPVVKFLLGKKQYSRSELLEISSNMKEGYIETRWNMIGELDALPWRPKVDVIGRTKFWYQTNQQGEKEKVQVYFYDEKWEIPAGLALLQFITPANTIANSSVKQQ